MKRKNKTNPTLIIIFKAVEELPREKKHLLPFHHEHFMYHTFQFLSRHSSHGSSELVKKVHGQPKSHLPK